MQATTQGTHRGHSECHHTGDILTVRMSPVCHGLGIWEFLPSKRVSACVDALHSAGLRAMWGMLGRWADVGVSSLEVQVQLFDALVSPVLVFVLRFEALLW